MKKPNENDILETALSIAEKGYPEAYQFLLNAYEESTSSFGPQTFYFLACLAGGANMPDLALAWLRKAIQENNWWYRPEVLEDDDLAALKSDAEFLLLKAISDDRYAAALSKAKAIFSWKKKRADNLFLAIHGERTKRRHCPGRLGTDRGNKWFVAVGNRPECRTGRLWNLSLEL